MSGFVRYVILNHKNQMTKLSILVIYFSIKFCKLIPILAPMRLENSCYSAVCLVCIGTLSALITQIHLYSHIGTR